MPGRLIMAGYLGRTGEDAYPSATLPQKDVRHDNAGSAIVDGEVMVPVQPADPPDGTPPVLPYGNSRHRNTTLACMRFRAGEQLARTRKNEGPSFIKKQKNCNENMIWEQGTGRASALIF
jgi:hypothetical protein